MDIGENGMTILMYIKILGTGPDMQMKLIPLIQPITLGKESGKLYWNVTFCLLVHGLLTGTEYH
jgi:hypothetical protein